MIRNFTILCKLNLQYISDIQFFSDSTLGFKAFKALCPSCKSKGCLSKHDSYPRYLIGMERGEPKTFTINVSRFICSTCGKSHALLPDVLVPYGSYSITFILSVLKEYFSRKSTVSALCQKYIISISTLYSWKCLYLKHKALWLGVLQNMSASPSVFLVRTFNLPDFSDLTKDFFAKLAFSFMQGSSLMTTSHLP